MKKLAFFGLFAFLVLSAIVLFRTLSNTMPQNTIPPARLMAVDAKVSAEHLAGAIRFKTVTLQNRADTDWHVFSAFQDWMYATYPDFYQAVSTEQVETYAQLNIWAGSDPDLAPVVFLAHQDVVPAHESDGGWDFPPFEGVIKNGFVYGRGAIDDKGALIAILEAANQLAKSGFQPRRTIIFAFGHDEEVSGSGAKAIVDRLAARNIHPWAVLDEGGAIVTGLPGMPGKVASIGVAEKGYLTLILTAKARGGHSSTPPEYTAIGALSKAIAKIESHPFANHRDQVMTKMLETSAPTQPFVKKMLLSNLWLFGPLVENTLRKTEMMRAMMGTSIAPTIIKAGFKENALPRKAEAYVNFRLHERDTIKSVMAHVKKVVDDENITIRISDNIGTEASPVSQIDTGPYLWIKEAVQASFPDALVLPNTVLGGTDSRHYAAITSDIYRFAPYVFDSSDIARIHGLGERMNVEAFAKAIAVYALLMQKSGQ